jgi:hypothetical protein
VDPSLLSESKSSNTKAAVFLVLTKRHPQSVAEIFENVRENFPKKITYQGVRKVVLSLANAGVIKRSSEGKYAISMEWIAKQKVETRELDVRYWVGQKRLPFELEIGESETYDFVGPKAIPYYWVFEEANKIQPDAKAPKKEKALVCCQNMWPLAYMSPKETAIVSAVLGKNGGFVLCKGDTEVDRYFAEFFKGNNMLPQTGAKLKFDYDILACNGYIFELKLEKKAMADWTGIYRLKKPMAQKMAELGKSVSAKRRMKIIARHDPEACTALVKWAEKEIG